MHCLGRWVPNEVKAGDARNMWTACGGNRFFTVTVMLWLVLCIMFYMSLEYFDVLVVVQRTTLGVGTKQKFRSLNGFWKYQRYSGLLISVYDGANATDSMASLVQIKDTRYGQTLDLHGPEMIELLQIRSSHSLIPWLNNRKRFQLRRWSSIGLGSSHIGTRAFYATLLPSLEFNIVDPKY